MGQLSKNKIRIKTDARKRQPPRDVSDATNPITFFAGTDLQFQLGIFDNDELIDDFANIAICKLQIKALNGSAAPPPTDAPLIDRSSTVFDATMTESEWDGGTKQHVVINVPAALSEVAIGPAWLTIWLESTDSTPEIYDIAQGFIEIKEDSNGTTSGSAPTEVFVNSFAKLGARQFTNAAFIDSQPSGAGFQTLNTVSLGGVQVWMALYLHSLTVADGRIILNHRDNPVTDGFAITIKDPNTTTKKTGIGFESAFSVTDGEWKTTNTDAPLDEWFFLKVSYDFNPINDPTIQINNAPLSAITEVGAAPSGTFTGAAQKLTVGNDDALNVTSTKMRIHQLVIVDDAVAESEWLDFINKGVLALPLNTIAFNATFDQFRVGSDFVHDTSNTSPNPIVPFGSGVVIPHRKAGLADPIFIEEHTGTTRFITAEDHGKTIHLNSGSNQNVSFPDNLPIGFFVNLVNIHATSVFTVIVATSTLKAPGTKLAVQYAGAQVYNVGGNIWHAIGDLTT